jgi:phosphodiesterase/alkaline phosphatase D-like protein
MRPGTITKVLLIASATTVTLAVFAASSLAHFAYLPLSKFGSAGSGAGQFNTPVGVAIDEGTEEVYVVDQGNNRVEKFDADGNYLSEFNGSETPAKAFSGPTYIAVDNSGDAAKGHVYVGDPSQGVVDVFDPSGKYLFQIAIQGAQAIATDRSGNLWVLTTQPSLEEYSEAGAVILRQPQIAEDPSGVTVDSKSNVYFTSSSGEIARAAPPDYPFGVHSIMRRGHTLAINPVTNNIFQDDGSSIVEWPPFGEEEGERELWEDTEEIIDSGLTNSHGLAVNGKSRELYASDESANDVEVFRDALTPDVVTGAATKLTRLTGTLEGTVNPLKTKAKYFFEWGETLSYGHSTTVEEAGEGEATIPVSADIEGLRGSTVYHYRIVGENENVKNYGQDATFETQAAVEGVLTDLASGVLAGEATLHGSFEPNGLDVHWSFQYGLTNAYGSNTPSQDAGQASEVKNVEATPTGLEANSIYHYRIAATNETGTTYGLDETFTTLPAPPVAEGAATASNVTRSSAILHATVNPKHSSTTYHFAYVEEAAYAPATSDPYAAGGATAPASLGSGSGGQPTEQLLVGLKPNTTYHYKVVAINQAGRVGGADATFTTGAPTRPVAVTGGASSIAQNSAIIDGAVNTSGLPTTYGFEVGTSTDYGPPTGLGSVGAGLSEASVSLALGGLQPGTTYHYRLTATNVDGTSYGIDQTFTTSVFASTFAEPPAPLPFVEVPPIAFPPESKTGIVLKKKTAKHKKVKKHRKVKKAKHKKKK